MRNLDFQYWANFCVSSNPSFRRGSFIVSRWRTFSTWTSISKSCQFNGVSCHKILPTRNLSHKTSVFASLTHSNVFWKIFESFVVSTQQVSLYWNIDQKCGYVKIDTTMGETRDSDSSFNSATSLSVLEEDWSETCWASSSHQSDTAPWTLSWLTETMMRNNNFAVAESPLYCIDVFPTPLLFKGPRNNALVPPNRGCPLSLRLNIIISAAWFHKPFEFVGVRSVTLFFSSWSEEWPTSFRIFFCVRRYTSTWRWFDVRTVQAEFCSPPSSFASLEANAVM